MIACSSGVNGSPLFFFSIRRSRILARSGSGPSSATGPRRRSASATCGSLSGSGDAFAALADLDRDVVLGGDLRRALAARHVTGDEEVLLGVAGLVVDGAQERRRSLRPATHREVRVDADRPRLLVEVGVAAALLADRADGRDVRRRQARVDRALDRAGAFLERAHGGDRGRGARGGARERLDVRRQREAAEAEIGEDRVAIADRRADDVELLGDLDHARLVDARLLAHHDRVRQVEPLAVDAGRGQVRLEDVLARGPALDGAEQGRERRLAELGRARDRGRGNRGPPAAAAGRPRRARARGQRALRSPGRVRRPRCRSCG